MTTQTLKKWQKMKLDDLGSVERGRSRHRPRNDAILYGGQYPFIQTGDVKNANLYIDSYLQTYNENGLAQSKLWDIDTLCITIAANIAESAILKIPACFPDSIVGFRSYEGKSDIRFVKYLLDVLKEHFLQISKGTTQDNLSLEKILSINFEVPEFGEQKEIAEILSTYDALIENNACRVKILGQVAGAIYTEWFINFRFPGHEKVKMIDSKTEFGKIPEGWKVEKVKDLVNFIKGFEPGSDNYYTEPGDGLVPFLRVGDLGARKSNLFVDKKLANGKILNRNDLVISMDGTVGIVKIGLEGAYSSGIRKVVGNDGNIGQAFLWQLVQSESIQNCIHQHAKGTTILHASGSIDFMQFVLPTQKLLDQYSEIAQAMKDSIIILESRNQNLRQARNLLLPKLVTGKLTISN